MKTFEMKISRDWDGRDLEKSFEITLHLDLDRNMIEFEIIAPYYRNPVPPCPPGPTWKLWEYEKYGIKTMMVNSLLTFLNIHSLVRNQI